MKAITISLINFKGGCTKTSSVVGLGAALARKGKRVLLVDCDPQGHVSVHLGINLDSLEASIENILGSRERSAGEVVQKTTEQNLWVIPSRRGLLHARQELSNKPRRDALLSKALRPLDAEFDFILIDTPPDEGLLSVNAMYASQHLIIPTPLDALSLTGINPLADSIYAMREAYEERPLNLLGVLINRYDERLKTENKRNLDELTSAFGEALFSTRIRADEEIRKAQANGQTIFQRNERSKGALDFAKLADEMIGRL